MIASNSPVFGAESETIYEVSTLSELYSALSKAVGGETISLAGGMYGEFQVRAMMPDTPGETLRFDTRQICEEGEVSWSQSPAEGQNPYELAEPAPFIKITE